MRLEVLRLGNSGLPSYACWIHGEAKQNGSLYPLVDPSTGEVFAQATAADQSMAHSALESARDCFLTWRNTPASQRAAVLRAFAERLRAEKEMLAETICKEVGKPIRSARDEVSSAAGLIDYFADESLRLTGEIPLLGHQREKVLIVREPAGVVAAITPFNYPLSTLAGKMAPALAVGCAVVAKPDEHTPLGALKMAQLASEAGLPAGAFNVLTGSGPEVGRLLVEHPIPRIVSFTGSTEVGKEIQAICSKFVRKSILELGGQCPCIICADAPWRDLLPQIVSQCMKNSGQYCYRISRIYVARAVYEPFLKELAGNVAALRVGPAADPEMDLGPLNNADILASVRSKVDEAIRKGAHAECGGLHADLPRRGFYFAPTVLTGVTAEMSIMQEEVFGPVVTVSPFDSVDDAIEEANASRYGLAAYLFSKDLGLAMDLVGRLEVGSVWINRIHQAYPEAPFGGMKESGLGREKSHFGLEEYTELKTIYLSF